MAEKVFTRKEAFGLYLWAILGCSLIGYGLCGESYNKGRRDAIKQIAAAYDIYKDGYEEGLKDRTND